MSGMIPWKGDRPIAGPLHKRNNMVPRNAYMLQTVFEQAIPAFDLMHLISIARSYRLLKISKTVSVSKHHTMTTYRERRNNYHAFVISAPDGKW
jgi:hypothetical protein